VSRPFRRGPIAPGGQWIELDPGAATSACVIALGVRIPAFAGSTTRGAQNPVFDLERSSLRPSARRWGAQLSAGARPGAAAQARRPAAQVSGGSVRCGLSALQHQGFKTSLIQILPAALAAATPPQQPPLSTAAANSAGRSAGVNKGGFPRRLLKKQDQRASKLLGHGRPTAGPTDTANQEGPRPSPRNHVQHQQGRRSRPFNSLSKPGKGKTAFTIPAPPGSLQPILA